MSHELRRRARILGSALILSIAIIGLGAPDARAAEGADRIHIMAFEDSDAIILESDGRFAMVDAGEDDAHPDGTDPRYPARAGITRWEYGYEDRLLDYMSSLGVTPENFDFFIGTHPHSDHIGSAADIIAAYAPERVYTPEYSDVFISDSNRLWDNLWTYDRLLEAADSVGAARIQRLSPEAPLLPDEAAPGLGADEFDFGDMRIRIVNYQEDYKFPGAVYDANLFAWGVEVTSHGHTAFLSADIEETDGDESRLVSSGALGHVDVLKLGHHGSHTSNSDHYLDVVSPDYAFVTGSSRHVPVKTADKLAELGTRWYTAAEAVAEGAEAFLVTFDENLEVTRFGDAPHVRAIGYDEPHYFAYSDGLPVKTDGFLPYADSGLFFAESATPLASSWHASEGAWYRLASDGMPLHGWFAEGPHWYYLDRESGAMATGWVDDAGSRYFMSPSGRMLSGWAQTEGRWYYLNPSGAMATGWAKTGGSWYYLDRSSGAMRTGWVADSGSWYFMNPSGAMSTGWVRDGGAWYYLDPASGAMSTGWVHDGGAWYYLDPASGAWT